METGSSGDINAFKNTLTVMNNNFQAAQKTLASSLTQIEQQFSPSHDSQIYTAFTTSQQCQALASSGGSAS